MTGSKNERLSNTLYSRLESHPNPWMRIKGTHISSNEQVTDFDFNAKAWSPRLLRLESVSPEFGPIKILDDGTGSQGVTDDVVRRFLEAAEAVTETNLKIEHVAVVDATLISQKLQRAANKVAYGGHVEVSLHDTATTYVVKSDSGDLLTIRAVWSFEWPGLRDPGPVNGQTPEDRRRKQQMEWLRRISNAMVDQVQGSIERHDVQPPETSFMRALEKYDLKYDEQGAVTEDWGRKSEGLKFKRWGCDE